MRKTKIVATLGPATNSPEVLRDLINAGLDVARFNFSHGDHDAIREQVKLVRSVCEEMGAVVALLADTKGPEIRLGTFKEGKVELVANSHFTLTTDEKDKDAGDAQKAWVSYVDFVKEVKPGTRVLLDDGAIELIVETVSGNNVTTLVKNGGTISNRKSLNVPGVSLNMPFISSRDRADLEVIAEIGFHFIAASFTRSANDVRDLRAELHRLNIEDVQIICKIENAEGVRNAEAILAAADGLMVARGDLGVELEFEELPSIQKDLIRKALQQGKNVVTATQMLESMIVHPRPTRAETSDVANAIYDGTSAIMLSAETSVGKYPVEAVATMAKIAVRTESDIDYERNFKANMYRHETSITNAIAHATVTTAHDLEAAAILCVSKSGYTAHHVSKFRPSCPVIVGTPDPTVQHQMKMAWGVLPILTKTETTEPDLFNGALQTATKEGHLNEGDLVIITAGVPVGQSGTTNMLKVHVLGEKMEVF